MCRQAASSLMKEPFQPHVALIDTHQRFSPTIPLLPIGPAGDVSVHLSRLKSIREHLRTCLQSVVCVRVAIEQKNSRQKLPERGFCAWCVWGRTSASWPSSPSPTKESIMFIQAQTSPKLPVLCGTGSRCVLSVPLPKLAYNGTVAAPPLTGCSLWKRKNSPKLPLPHINGSSQYGCHRMWGCGGLGISLGIQAISDAFNIRCI